MLVLISRTLKQGFQNVWRNGWLSLASISVLLFSLFLISILFTVTMTANQLIKDVEEKVNVSVYFKSDVTEEKIDEVKRDLQRLSEVKSVEYISKEEALEEFKKNNAGEPAILESLEEIGENPLLSYLIIKGKSSDKYEAINSYIKQSSYMEDVSRINYEKNKEIINKFNGIISQIRKVGVILGTIFALVAVLITFNTVRITIYTHKQEIEIMRLVGASNFFIRLPFIFEGIFYGITASLVSMLCLFLVLHFGGGYVAGKILSEGLVSFYAQNWLELLGLQIFLGSFLGIVGSIIAMRKYLKV